MDQHENRVTSGSRNSVDGDEKNVMKKWKFDEEVKMEDWTKRPIIWSMVFGLLFMHITGIYAITCLPYMKWQTHIWNVVMFHYGMFGMTGGAHRLWTHRAYKAKTPLRIFIMLGYSSFGSLSYDLFTWIRDHRVHHRYTETEMDPYNAKQGFFYCHIGWFFLKKSPACLRALRKTNMQDIFEDPVVMFERRNHFIVTIVMAIIMPTLVPMLLWTETFTMAYCAAVFRCVSLYHATWSVNSFAHMWGWRPFNKNIMAAENVIVSFFAMGEGWHNFHHMFPWDYKTSEGGFVNSSTHFINLFQRLGLAYDLKTASPELVRNVILKYGDGSHAFSGDKIQEISEETLNDPKFLSSLPKPTFNKH